MADMTESLIEKALRLVEQRRVELLPRTAGQPATARVIGDSDTYTVTADSRLVRCTCPKGGKNFCSHRLAALISWGDALEHLHQEAEMSHG